MWGEASSQRALGEPREGAVEITPVGQVSTQIQKARHVHDGNGDQRSPEASQGGQLDDAPNDLDSIELVAVDGGRDE